jgi:hypothetical protein
MGALVLVLFLVLVAAYKAKSSSGFVMIAPTLSAITSDRMTGTPIYGNPLMGSKAHSSTSPLT